MLALGFWQLNRLGERRDRNAIVAARIDQPTRPLDVLVQAGQPRYANATLTGRYRAEPTPVVGNRSIDGAPGFWVLNIMDTDAGPRVVIRGFANRAQVSNSTVPPPPDGELTVTGYVETSVDGLLVQGDRIELNRLDTSALGGALGLDLGRYALVLDEPSEGLLPVPRPPIGDGPHLGYAVQWFIFSVIAGGGYVLILRRQAETSDRPAGQPDSLRP